jgi:hypothetical protein
MLDRANASEESMLKEHLNNTEPTVKLDKNMLPTWFEVTDDINPKTKEKIIEIYNRKHK